MLRAHRQSRRFHSLRTAVGLLSFPESLEDRRLLAADAVLQWNNVLLDAIREDKTAPPVAARAMAIVQTAVFDAVNSIDREYQPYLGYVDVRPDASKEAAVSAAAHSTLVALFPAQESSFDKIYGLSLASIPDGHAETDGIAAGEASATRILAWRGSDGSDRIVSYTSGTSIGDWQPTPPSYASPLLPQWPDVTPWAMQSADQFMPPAPPKLTSVRYAANLNQVQRLGAADSLTRTADQTQIAWFWANGPGTSTPPGHWNVIAQIVAADRQTSLEENARLFALLNMALADAAIVSWNAKYEHNLWRPVTAIQQADLDGNALTKPDADWTPLLVTPPFPTYTSGHSTFSGTGAAVLRQFFGSDRADLVLPSETADISDRRFRSFSQAAEESGISRIYGGIHFNFDNRQGLRSGKRLGSYVATHYLGRTMPGISARVADGELFVSGTSRSEVIRISQQAGVLTVSGNGRIVGRFQQPGVAKIFVDAKAGDDFVTLVHVDISSELHGGTGNDVLLGGRSDDSLFGDDGDDLLFGRNGNDQLDGGSGRNRLYGGAGNDSLSGIHGLDDLFGGSGLDELFWG